MEEFRKDLQSVYRELAGASGMFKVTQVLPDTVRQIREVADEDPTLATPSAGLPPFNITPPSGALARVPAPDATPTSASISGGARPPLELVNFRDPSAEGVGDETAVGARRSTETAPAGSSKTRLTILAALLILGVAGAEVYRLLNREPEAARPGARLRVVAPTPAVAPTVAQEFPVPKLGEGEAAHAAPAVPPPAPEAAPTAVRGGAGASGPR